MSTLYVFGCKIQSEMGECTYVRIHHKRLATNAQSASQLPQEAKMKRSQEEGETLGGNKSLHIVDFSLQ